MSGERVIKMKKIIYAEEISRKLDLSNVLIFRPLGKKAKEMILEDIKELNAGDIIEMNFKNIKACDVSFVDEMIIEIQQHVKQRNNLLLYLSHINNREITDNLEAALALHMQKKKENIQVLQLVQNCYCVIGKLEQNLQKTFELLSEKTSITAREVAEIFGTEINSASNRLKKLFDYGLVLRKEVVDTNGRLHEYCLPNIKLL